MERFGIPGTARASFAVYNTLAEVDAFADALARIVEAARKARSLPVRSRSAARREAALCGGDAADLPAEDGAVSTPRRWARRRAAVAEEIAEVFDLLEDWGDRYQYLIELGEKLPPMPDEMKTECTRVHGCQSTVYLAARQKPGTARRAGVPGRQRRRARARADRRCCEHLFSGQQAKDILAFDVEGFFRRLGLDSAPEHGPAQRPGGDGAARPAARGGAGVTSRAAEASGRHASHGSRWR